ncbi:SprT-like family protein [Synechococcus sp. MIT S9509]|uniref:SprT-like domain-containing protein n=1 Tax=Synechococcus sp. MIT S9509 TaxID=1801630 RepID=UPI0007BB5A2B|nr:SprT-like domain-containing protein [Synechococcus sp. MIT S9509]KZR92354.1 SprT-like family protein [Synechococcus sp. MIT S9509]
MTISPSRTSPALEQARRLQRAADIFNRELFNSELPPTMLRLERQKTSRGFYSPDKFVDEQGNKLDAITLNSTDASERPLIELLSTLVHEQCHQYICRVVNKGAATGGHGPAWRQQMLLLGLPPIKVGATWRQATHSIDPDGAYANCFRANLTELERLPWKELSRDATRGRARGLDKVRFQCPSCGSKAWARAAAQLLCGTCSTTACLVVMLPEVRAEGGSGSGGGSTARSVRTDYPEPSTTPGLPVWTDELGRQLRVRCGIDHPPQNIEEALIVLRHGLSDVVFKLDPQSPDFDEQLKRNYRKQAAVLHPDAGGHEEAFKVLQIAYRMLKQEGG